ncbi:MAG: hypothetical protein HKN00_10610 [Flavobacteriaceae bacterium]|nr:hypothetical protein [Bacteroidia bacterium]NNF75628.1 hypothetical protein [Flavobacteriaceae bacterium]NNK71616.1 hypothetical protein [Flavobacteriaceae bacterium]
MKKNAFYTLLLLLGFAMILGSCKNKDREASPESSLGAEKADLAMNDVYQCPMDCEEGKTYDEEGKCPVCKMDLKKVEKDDLDKQNDSSEEDEEDHSGHDHD